MKLLVCMGLHKSSYVVELTSLHEKCLHGIISFVMKSHVCIELQSFLVEITCLHEKY